MKRLIVVIEDNSELSEIISIFLKKEGFDTIVFGTAEDGYDYLAEKTADLIILDINLPGMDGYEFLNKIRKRIATPVLIVTARQSNQDVITGLGYGADDFLTKPFSSDILVARIRALLRRAEGKINTLEKTVSFGPYLFYPQTMELFKDDQQIPLSTRESKLLNYLLENADTYKDPETIYTNVWKNKYGDLTIVAVYIQRLRRKIESKPASPQYIKTMFGSGYGFILHNKEENEKK